MKLEWTPFDPKDAAATVAWSADVLDLNVHFLVLGSPSTDRWLCFVGRWNENRDEFRWRAVTDEPVSRFDEAETACERYAKKAMQ